MWGVLLSAILLLLSGCASTPTDLRSDPGAVVRFTTDQNYQAVYKTIIDRARVCYQSSVGYNSLMVQGELLPDLKRADISIVMMNGIVGVQDQFALCEIRAVDEGTEVVGMSKRNLHYMVDNMKEWILENSQKCGH